MPQYKASLVVSPAKGGLGLLFSVKGRLTKAIIDITPEAQTLRIRGTDPAVSAVDHNLAFEDIEEITGLGPMIAKIRLKDGREIQLKNVDDLIDILNLLSQYVPETTPELVRSRIERFEKRLWKE